MAIRDREILRVIKPAKLKKRPILSTPSLLRKFAGNIGRKADWFDVWLKLDLVVLKQYLENTCEHGNVSQLNFHHRLHDHIAEAMDWIEDTLSLLYRQPDQHRELRTQIDEVKARMESTSRRLVPKTMLPPIDMRLTYPRKPSLNKDKGRDRPAPRAPLHLAVPMLELINGEFTQQFNEYELSSVIGDITGYTNVSKYRLKHLKEGPREELIAILEQMIGRIKGLPPQ